MEHLANFGTTLEEKHTRFNPIEDSHTFPTDFFLRMYTATATRLHDTKVKGKPIEGKETDKRQFTVRFNVDGVTRNAIINTSTPCKVIVQWSNADNDISEIRTTCLVWYQNNWVELPLAKPFMAFANAFLANYGKAFTKQASVLIESYC